MRTDLDVLLDLLNRAGLDVANDAEGGRVTVFCKRGADIQFAFTDEGQLVEASVEFDPMNTEVGPVAHVQFAPLPYKLCNVEAVTRACAGFLPLAAEKRNTLVPGDRVTLRVELPDGAHQVLRTMVTTRCDDGGYIGRVADATATIDGLRIGEEIGFGSCHVFAIEERA